MCGMIQSRKELLMTGLAGWMSPKVRPACKGSEPSLESTHRDVRVWLNRPRCFNNLQNASRGPEARVNDD